MPIWHSSASTLCVILHINSVSSSVEEALRPLEFAANRSYATKSVKSNYKLICYFLLFLLGDWQWEVVLVFLQSARGLQPGWGFCFCVNLSDYSRYSSHQLFFFSSWMHEVWILNPVNFKPPVLELAKVHWVVTKQLSAAAHAWAPSDAISPSGQSH